MEKYGRAGQATDDNKTRRICFAYCIPKATNTHNRVIKYMLHFAGTVVRRTRLCYVVHTVPVFLINCANQVTHFLLVLVQLNLKKNVGSVTLEYPLM